MEMYVYSQKSNGFRVIAITDQVLSRINLHKIVSDGTWGPDILTTSKMYLQYIRAKIAYACEVWGRTTVTHFRCLETV